MENNFTTGTARFRPSPDDFGQAEQKCAAITAEMEAVVIFRALGAGAVRPQNAGRVRADGAGCKP